MDAATIGAIAAIVVPTFGGFLALARTVVNRHLAALTRLEAQAAASTDIQSQIASALDLHRDHLVDLHREQLAIRRGVQRLTDAAGLPETESAAPNPPPPLPMGRTIRRPEPSRPPAVDVESSALEIK